MYLKLDYPLSWLSSCGDQNCVANGKSQKKVSEGCGSLHVYKRRKALSLEGSFSHSPQQPAVRSHILFLKEKLLRIIFIHSCPQGITGNFIDFLNLDLGNAFCTSHLWKDDVF